jgi:SAM-dependent methyltransferase
VKDLTEKQTNQYGDVFSKIYNLYWTELIDMLYPGIIKYFLDHKQIEVDEHIVKREFIDKIGEIEKYTVLDLFCGTGRLSRKLLNTGLTVTGIDLSESMISVAKQLNKDQIDNNKLKLIVDDARTFQLEDKFDLIVTTFDSLNHLNTIEELESVINNVFKHVDEDGLFIFDLNTARGLRHWDFIDVEDYEDATFLQYGKYVAEEQRAYTRVTGFMKIHGSNLYEKFNEVMSNTIYAVDDILQLLNNKWSRVICVDPENFKPVDDPEKLDRIVLIAHK